MTNNVNDGLITIAAQFFNNIMVNIFISSKLAFEKNFLPNHPYIAVIISLFINY